MRGKTGIAVLAALGLLAGCGGDDAGWTPVLEGTPPTFLEEELTRVVADVRAARQAAPEGGEADEVGEVGESLASAQGRLERLLTVYLPLYRAKVAAANAYRRLELGEAAAARRGVDEVEERVLAVSRATGGDLESELEGVLESVADVRVALEAGSPDAALHIQRLAETLDNLLTRAGLYL